MDEAEQNMYILKVLLGVISHPQKFRIQPITRGYKNWKNGVLFYLTNEVLDIIIDRLIKLCCANVVTFTYEVHFGKYYMVCYFSNCCSLLSFACFHF